MSLPVSGKLEDAKYWASLGSSGSKRSARVEARAKLREIEHRGGNVGRSRVGQAGEYCDLDRVLGL